MCLHKYENKAYFHSRIWKHSCSIMMELLGTQCGNLFVINFYLLHLKVEVHICTEEGLCTNLIHWCSLLRSGFNIYYLAVLHTNNIIAMPNRHVCWFYLLHSGYHKPKFLALLAGVIKRGDGRHVNCFNIHTVNASSRLAALSKSLDTKFRPMPPATISSSEGGTELSVNACCYYIN